MQLNEAYEKYYIDNIDYTGQALVILVETKQGLVAFSHYNFEGAEMNLGGEAYASLSLGIDTAKVIKVINVETMEILFEEKKFRVRYNKQINSQIITGRKTSKSNCE
jgi:hypothetical protein